MILSDKDIKRYIKEKKLRFAPKLSDDQIGPASIDLKLGNIFKIFRVDAIWRLTQLSNPDIAKFGIRGSLQITF